MKENNEEKLIYGEKFKKLHFIKDYMYSEKTRYEEGRFVIDQIEKHQPKEEVFKHRKCRTEIDEEVELEQRIMPVKRNPVNIRFLTFID